MLPKIGLYYVKNTRDHFNAMSIQHKNILPKAIFNQIENVSYYV